MCDLKYQTQPNNLNFFQICAERSAIVTAISTNGPEDFEIQALAVVG